MVRAAPSLISTDLEITGNLRTSGEVQLDGIVTGDINCAKLVIGEKAVIAGHIEADEVTIRGQVTGRIEARDVHLAKTARVIGDIWHDSLAIDAGAFLDGHCKRNDAKQDSVTSTALAPWRRHQPARLPRNRPLPARDRNRYRKAAQKQPPAADPNYSPSPLMLGSSPPRRAANDASMKWSRSPSSTRWASPRSTPVRKSLTI